MDLPAYRSNIKKLWKPFCVKGKEKQLEQQLWEAFQDRDDFDGYQQACFQVTQLLSENESFDIVSKKVASKQFGFEDPYFDDCREAEKNEIQYIEQPVKVEDGIHECRSCGSKKTYSIQKQVRSGDEAMTLFIQCTKCQKKWTM